MNRAGLVSVLCSSALLSLPCTGCSPGYTQVLNGPADHALVCDPSEIRTDGCPPCSVAVGSRCQDRWYWSAQRCSSDAQCGAPGACQLGYCVGTDQDADGIDDTFEREVAERNFPKVLLDTDEQCAVPWGVIYRVRRHPQNPRRIAIAYDVLNATDCGDLNGHVGDTENFAITVDLDAEPGAAATVGVKAWAHMNTVCGSTSSCETAPGTKLCASPPGTASSTSEVIIWTSRNKHEAYLSRAVCDDNCFDSCSVGQRVTGPLLDVGQPGHPLVTDLTTQGFVQSADGWADELLHFNPWSTAEFSGGGRLDTRSDLLAPPGE